MHRKYIGIEISGEYCKNSIERLNSIQISLDISIQSAQIEHGFIKSTDFDVEKITMGKMSKEEKLKLIQQLQLELENDEAIELIEGLKGTLNSSDITENFETIKNSILEIASKFNGVKPGRKAGATKKTGSTPAKTSPIERLTKVVLGIGPGRLSDEKKKNISDAQPVIGKIADELNIEVTAKMDQKDIDKIRKEYNKQQKANK